MTTCAICMDEIYLSWIHEPLYFMNCSPYHILKCNHMYHRVCLLKLIENSTIFEKPLCPLCREKFTRNSVLNSHMRKYKYQGKKYTSKSSWWDWLDRLCCCY